MLLHYPRRLLLAARCATQEQYLDWLLAQPVAALGFDGRILHSLDDLGIWTLGDLARTAPGVLRGCCGLGPDSLGRITRTVRRVLTSGVLPEEAVDAELEAEIDVGLAAVRGQWSPQEEYGRRVTRCGPAVEGRAGLPATRWNNRIHG